jgi:hypothetical protein
MAVINAPGAYKDDAVSGYTTEIGRIFHEDEERFMDRDSRLSLLLEEEVSKQAGGSVRDKLNTLPSDFRVLP